MEILILLAVCLSFAALAWMWAKLCASVRWFWARRYQIGGWSGREIGSPVLCFVSVYLGVMSTTLIPSAILRFLAASWLVSFSITPLAALPVAILVFDKRAYPRWRTAANAPLGERILCACSDGVSWWRWCRAPH